MRYFEEDANIYNDQIRKIEKTDPVEAEFINDQIIQNLINNTAFVRNLADDIAEKLCKHIEDSDRLVPIPIQEALDAYYAQLTAYSDKGIADLINGAPTTLDTLKELADAIKENQNVQSALDAAIGTKANANEFNTHTGTMASKTASGHVKVDDAMSSSSTNPVQNKIVKAELDKKANTSHSHADIWEKVYPVGAIYISAVNTSPATLFGGTWEQIKTGYLKAGTSYDTKTNGNDTTSGSTTLTAAQSGSPAHNHGMNKHTHSFSATTSNDGGHTHSVGIKTDSMAYGGSNVITAYVKYGIGGAGTSDSLTAASAGSHTHTISGTTGEASSSTENSTNANASQGHTHSINLNYVQVYMWRRTA
ncbi:MAG: hypothetical protein NC412_09695 [Roseburia sp.]|nr:hypothetical protein [Roseburia sp.]